MTTRWMDNDVYGHVNNVIYYSFFDTAVNATLIERGLLDPMTSPVIGLVVETGCRYAAALSFPEVVDAGIRVSRIGSSSVRYEVGLFKQGDELAAAEGYFVHVYVDAENRRPTPIPADLRSFLETLA
jgi:acyl-CoA thioester hydrolase